MVVDPRVRVGSQLQGMFQSRSSLWICFVSKKNNERVNLQVDGSEETCHGQEQTHVHDGNRQKSVCLFFLFAA